MDKKKILDNFIESKLVRFFIVFITKNWIYGTLSYTDFNFNILSFNDFLELIKQEIDFTIPYEKGSEERLLPFKLYLLIDNEFIILDEINYLSYIEKKGVIIFGTQDESIGFECFNYFKDSTDGKQFLN